MYNHPLINKLTVSMLKIGLTDHLLTFINNKYTT